MTDWVEHCICWHVYPLGFLGAPETRLTPGEPVQHRLGRLEPWLDYLVELGASGLLLGPVFESTSHGYDTVDYYAIDRRLGDADDFDALVAAAHRRGVRVLLDGVFNHVGRDHPSFAAALAGGPDSSEAELFHLYFRGPGAEPDYEHFEGHRALVTLNHTSARVVDLVVDVMCHWLGRGADGWRLDAAYAVDPQFWAQVLPRVRERFPQAYVFAEVIHGDYAAFVQASGVDSVTQYELWKATWSSLNDHNLHELAWTLRRHDELCQTFAPVTFLGNHDVTRIASKLTDASHLGHAVAVLATVGGMPCVYAGDEQGYRGIKRDQAGGDVEVRPPFPATPAELSQLGRPILDLHRQLLALRRQHPWLHHARTSVEHVTNDELVYRSAHDGQALLVALNLADHPAALPVAGVGAVLAGSGQLLDGGRVQVPGPGWAVLG